MEDDLVERLERNARFYTNEAKALAEHESRRDIRHLGTREAKTIADLLAEAAQAIQALMPRWDPAKETGVPADAPPDLRTRPPFLKKSK